MINATLLSKGESSDINVGDSIIESSIVKNYLALKLIQNLALMTRFKIYVTKLTENCEHYPSNSLHKSSHNSINVR